MSLFGILNPQQGRMLGSWGPERMRRTCRSEIPWDSFETACFLQIPEDPHGSLERGSPNWFGGFM